MMAYSTLYLITNLFGTYVLYKLVEVFFGRPFTSRVITLASYLMYFSVVSFVYLKYEIPILTLLVNMLLIFSLTLNYKATYKRRIIWSTFIYVFLAVIETFIVIIIEHNADYTIFEKNGFESLGVLITAKLLSYIVVLIMGYFKKTKEQIEIPSTYGLALVLVPLAILYLILCLLASNLSQLTVIIGILLLLGLSIISFRLYDGLGQMFELNTEKRLLSQQNQYLNNQYQLIEASARETKSLNHDLSNHFTALEILIDANDKAKILSYLERLKNSVIISGEYARSGVMIIDGILNYKLSSAASFGIRTSLNISIPDTLELNSFDMMIILGNLLDNAIEANCKISADERCISISINFAINCIIISIKNKYDEQSLKKNYKTSKADRNSHGFGLQQVQKIIDQYQGELEINTADGFFEVKALLYLE